MRVLPLLTLARVVASLHCYSCQGSCPGNQRYCDCMTGDCEGDYCFSERAEARDGAFGLRKGCGRGHMLRRSPGCDFVESPGRTVCLCRSEFCNRDVVSGERPRVLEEEGCADCAAGGGHCRVREGRLRCGHGAPVLPLLAQTWALVNESSPRACAWYEVGTKTSQQCVCRTAGDCRSAVSDETGVVSNVRELSLCYSCHTHQEFCSEANYCEGQFCFLKVTYRVPERKHWRELGCLTTNRPEEIVFHQERWVHGEEEEIQCVCRGYLCNKDYLSTCAAAKLRRECVGSLALVLLIVRLVAL
jgi:hypothetical protein